jgi:hypothetical protein
MNRNSFPSTYEDIRNAVLFRVLLGIAVFRDGNDKVFATGKRLLANKPYTFIMS